MLNDTIYAGDVVPNISQYPNRDQIGPRKEYDTVEILVSENRARYRVNDVTNVTIMLLPIEEIKNIESKLQLAIAANELLLDYEHDKELTIFTSIDFEDFYE